MHIFQQFDEASYCWHSGIEGVASSCVVVHICTLTWCALSVRRYIACAVQKVPPAMTPSAAMVERDIKNMRHAPHIDAHAPGEHSIPVSSLSVATGVIFRFVEDDMELGCVLREVCQKKSGRMKI